jgi:hypothetical protein
MRPCSCNHVYIDIQGILACRYCGKFADIDDQPVPEDGCLVEILEASGFEEDPITEASGMGGEILELERRKCASKACCKCRAELALRRMP